jgi:hypothetical protein
MRFTFSALCAFFLLSLVPAASAAPAGSCSVSPNPVSLGTPEAPNSFTIYATGLRPNTWYVVDIRMRGGGANDGIGGTPNSDITTDADGNGSVTHLTYEPYNPRLVLTVGTAQVSMKPNSEAQQGTRASCNFEVVA